MRDDDRLLGVIIEVLRVHGRIRALFRGVETATGLSKIELTVLASVGEARMPPTVSQLGRSLGHPRQVIQRTANELIARRLMQSSENPRHKRAGLLSLTERGQTLKAEADKTALQISSQIAQGADVNDLAATAANLRAIRRAIDRHLTAQREE